MPIEPISSGITTARSGKMDSVLDIFGHDVIGAALLGLAIGLGILGLAFGVMKLTKRKKVTEKVTEIEKPIGETKDPWAAIIAAAGAGTFYISEFKISPPETKAGEMVNISFKVTNTGDTFSLYRAGLKINGKEIGTVDMDLAPEQTELATFAVAETAAGEYKVEVAGFEGRFVIPPASLNVSAIDINPRRIQEKGQVSVMAEVTNSGGASGTQKVEIRLKDKVLVSEELTIAPGASQRVNITLTNLEPGTHEVRMGDFRDTFAVEMLNYFEPQ